MEKQEATQRMKDWLSARSALSPNHVAVHFQGETQTYAQLEASVNAWCGRLLAVGVRPGNRVGVLLASSHDYVALVHALARLGGVLVPLNTRLTAAEIRWQLDNTACTHLITAEQQSEIGFENIWTLDALRSVEIDEQLPTQGDFDLSAIQAIIFTSGTTGHPKGVQITFGNHFYSAMASAYRLGHQPEDCWLSVLPLYHVGGLAVLFRSVLYGITVDLHPRFAVDAIQRAFDTRSITMISLVPTMLYRLLEAEVRWPESLRLILLGGAAASPELLARAWAVELPIAPTYGLTEATSQVATMRPGDARQKPGSVGRPLLLTSVRIVDEHGQDHPTGEYGEVLVQGPTVMAGYHNNAKATERTLRDGWLHTGDIGYLDADGDLFLVQRRSDLIVTGGENVYPAEVETVLRTHPAVAEAAVVGVGHPEWGQQVAAVIVLDADMSLTADELTRYAREHLAGYKIPRQIAFTDALPQTASGKVERKKLKTFLQKAT